MEKGCDVIYECPIREKILAIQGQGYERRREELAQTLPLDLTPSNKHGTNFDDDDDHVGPLPSSYSVFGNGIKNIFFSLSIINQCTT